MYMQSVICILLYQFQGILCSPVYGSFWQLTDIHFDPWYYSNQTSCNKHLTNPGKYGSFECDASFQLAKSTIKAMTNISPNVDFILWSGDNVPHVSADKYDDYINNQVVTDITRNLTDILMAAFPGRPILPVLGNHDFYPKNQLPANGSVLYDQYADIWKTWLNTEDMQSTFKKGGYYTTMLNPGKKIRAIILNSNLHLSSNRLTQGMSDPADQFAWAASIMDNARRDGEKVYVFTHVQTGMMPDTILGTAWSSLDSGYNTRQVQQFTQYADVILAIFTAHAHHDIFKLYFHEDKAVAAMFVPPSVTPLRYLVNKEKDQGTARNPALRLVLYDKETYEPVDIKQYSLDLNEANKKGAAEWSLVYRFSEAYGVGNISVGQLHNVLKDFNKPGGRSFDVAYELYTVKTRHPGNPVTCNCQCKTAFICSVQYQLYNEFERCYKRQAPCDLVNHGSEVCVQRYIIVIYVLCFLLVII